MSVTCKGFKKNGDPCSLLTKAKDGYCRFHSPLDTPATKKAVVEEYVYRITVYCDDEEIGQYLFGSTDSIRKNLFTVIDVFDADDRWNKKELIPALIAVASTGGTYDDVPGKDDVGLSVTIDKVPVH